MSAWALFQIFIDAVLVCGLVLQTRKMLRAPKDDPRLSRGLQLLQSKIAVLEDLSDRTDVQVKQLSALLDQKTREVQERIYEAEHHVQSIKHSMNQSLEVASIFQDKIPHQEIIERQNTKKYIHAAQMAHQGMSVDEIAKSIDLPRGELELIAKINRDHLVFEEDQLPAWAQSRSSSPSSPNSSQPSSPRSQSFTPTTPPLFIKPPQAPTPTLEQLGQEFRKAHPNFDMSNTSPQAETSSLVNRFASTKIFQKAAQILENPSASPQEASPEFPIPHDDPQAPQHPFEFKKINLSDSLG